jgi:hypothetical protein
MIIPGLGRVTEGDDSDLLCSGPIPVPVLGGQECCFQVEGYLEDPDQQAFHVAIENFLMLDKSVLKAAEEHLFQYYKDFEKDWAAYDKKMKPIKSAAEVWSHVRLGDEPVVSRRAYGDKGIYISLGGGCDWEEEHGLQIVFKNGLKVNKVGPFDGHVTNSDAVGEPKLENVIYRGFS